MFESEVAPELEVEERDEDKEDALPSALRGSLEGAYGADLGDVRVHTGGDATRQAEGQDARAFTRGTDIFFNQGEYNPGTSDGDHLIAHEVAHVVQNRGGSAAGDQRKARIPEATSAEAEADRAADTAVARIYDGRDQVAPIGAAPTGDVMRKPKTSDAKPKEQPDDKTLYAVSSALHDILKNKDSRPRSGKYALALLHLEWAAIDNWHSVTYTPDQRLAFLEAALAMLRPVLGAMLGDSRWNLWLQNNRIMPLVKSLRGDLHDKKAAARVEAVATGEGWDVGASTDAEAKKLKKAIADHISATAKLSDLSNKVVNLDPLEGKDLVNAGGKDLAAGKGALGLNALNDTLQFASKFLEMNDEKFVKKQAEISKLTGFANVSTRLEFIKSTAELLQAGVSATSKTATLIALRLNNPELVKDLDKITKSKALPNVVSAVTLVHSICVWLDKDATDREKMDAGLAGAEALTQLTATGAEAAGYATGATVLAGVAFVGFTTIKLVMFAKDLYWAARAGVTTAWMQLAFKTMDEDGQALVALSESLAITSGLLASEQDEDQKRALAKLEQNTATKLGHKIDAFLDKCEKYKYEPGAARKPSSFRTLREALSVVRDQRGKTEPTEALEAANKVIRQIAWCFEHSEYLIAAESQGGGVVKAAALEQADREEKEEKRREQEEKRREQEAEDRSTDDGYGA